MSNRSTPSVSWETIEPTRAELAARIQHTRIETPTTEDEMVRHAREAVEYGFNAAMVSGSWLPVVARELRGTPIAVASALDFPTVGLMTTAGKAAEAEELVRLGATQIDIGVQIGWLKSGDYDAFRDDIATVVRAAGVPIKVMLELPMLTSDEKLAAIDLAIEAGVAYLKNASSGSVEVANVDSIAFLADRAPEGVRVKASGSIKRRSQAIALLRAGADLLGTSAGIAIVSDTADDDTPSY